jgi:multidrug resistance efflux pump
MRELFGKVLRRRAPGTRPDSADPGAARAGLEARLQESTLSLHALQRRVESLEATIAELQEEIDETRRDGRRVAELYDLVFERLRSSSL